MKTYLLLTALTISYAAQAQSTYTEEILLEKSSVSTQKEIPQTWNTKSLQELKKEVLNKNKSMTLSKEQWTQASAGTPDVFQVDSFMGGVGMVPKLDKLAPGSKGCFGFINQQKNGNKKEYLGINLTKPLEEGKSYTLSFWMYKQEGTPKASIALFGSDQEKALPFGNENSMESPTFYNDNFEVLGWAEYKDASDWRKVYITFTATKNFQSLVLGPDEEESPAGVNARHYNYYFIDGITLNQTKNNSPSSITINDTPLFLPIPNVNVITPSVTTPNGNGNNGESEKIIP